METVKEQILSVFPSLNDDQKRAIFETEGPTVIVAGPGTGKTFVLVLRTLYILLSGKAEPDEIILTTFTEKSAFELRDRISQFSKKLTAKLNLHELITGTIHGICDTFIANYVGYTPLKKNFTVLDDLTVPLFINEYFDEIVEPFKVKGQFFGRWGTKWKTIDYTIEHFNKITEELIDPARLISSKDQFLKLLGKAYKKYRKILFENNKIDFAFQEKIFYDLLHNKKIGSKIKSGIKYLLIDEYQDTNYIQEQIAFQLTSRNKNICVVGDEDQALYRFRGATVRNILEFPKHFKGCKRINLLENFRSHKMIIDSYNNFIKSIDWNNYDGENDFRYPNKVVTPSSKTISPDYPAVLSIWGKNEKDEADRFANLAKYLKDNKIIQDYSDIALLLRSVRLDYSGPFIEALGEKNINAFCPRARAYFDNDEVRTLLACFIILFGFIDDDLNRYYHHEIIEEGIKILAGYTSSPISRYLRRKSKEIEELAPGQTLDENVVDFLYQLMAYKPFTQYILDENKARNLSVFSLLLSTFQTYYHYPVITAKNKIGLKYRLFNSFFNLLLNTGYNEYEDENNPIPKGYVQIMTIHQSKGLEFPVVVVGSLDKSYQAQKFIDKVLSPFYKRTPFEPEDRITQFDWARSFYVAFSRPQKLLVLSTNSEPKDIFNSIWEGLDQWPHVEKKVLKAQQFESKSPFIPKKSLSLTSHINVYETCVRQYQFYKDLEFTPSRTGQLLFGTLVHETIEDIHRAKLDNEKIFEKSIQNSFENNYKALLANGFRPIAKKQKEEALNHVLNYYYNNKDLLQRIVETEVDVSVEKDQYIITGKIDLLLGRDQKLEVLDFKSQKKPKPDDPLIDRYRKQLNLYAFILKERHQKVPERLYIYWTGEEHRKDALMEIEYDEKLVQAAGEHFDKIAADILAKKFIIKQPPDVTKVCKECDIRFYCHEEGTIKLTPKA